MIMEKFNMFLPFFLPSMLQLLVSYNNDKNKGDKNNLKLKLNLKPCSVQDIASHLNTISDLNKLCGDCSVFKSKIKRC